MNESDAQHIALAENPSVWTSVAANGRTGLLKRGLYRPPVALFDKAG